MLKANGPQHCLLNSRLFSVFIFLIEVSAWCIVALYLTYPSMGDFIYLSYQVMLLSCRSVTHRIPYSKWIIVFMFHRTGNLLVTGNTYSWLLSYPYFFLSSLPIICCNWFHKLLVILHSEIDGGVNSVWRQVQTVIFY